MATTPTTPITDPATPVARIDLAQAATTADRERKLDLLQRANRHHERTPPAKQQQIKDFTNFHLRFTSGTSFTFAPKQRKLMIFLSIFTCWLRPLQIPTQART